MVEAAGEALGAQGGWGQRSWLCWESQTWAGGACARSLPLPSELLVISIWLLPQQNVHALCCALVCLSGLLRDRLFPVHPSVPACGSTRVLCPGGRARLHFSERAEHGVRGHGLRRRLAGAADIHRGSDGQLVSTTGSSVP